MADDHNARYRSGDSYGREPGRPEQGNDPLAELARLIGRSDPFAELDRAAAEHNAAQQHYAEHPPARYAGEPAPGYAPEPNYPPPPNFGPPPGFPPGQNYDPLPQQSYPGAPHPLRPLPNFGSDPLFGEPLPPRQSEPPPQHFEANPPTQPDWPPAPASSAPPYEHDPFALPSAASAQHTQHAQQPAEPRFDPPNFGAPPPPRGEFQPELPGFPPPPFMTGSSERPPFAQPVYPSGPQSGAMPPPHDDEFYDDAPRNERRKGMVTVLAVLGLAVLGTAAAFGYRSMFGGPSVSSPPPIIRASNEPAKVVPPQSAAVDSNANKINYDRFADRSQNEQVVVREERPIDTNDLVRSTAPRVVMPSGPSLTSPPQAQSGNPPGTIGEPRRVRTVPIRPDGSDTAAPSQQVGGLPPPMPVTPQRQPATTASNAPLDVTPSGASRQPAPPQTRTAARAPIPEPVRPPARAAAPSANAPLSLSPDGSLPPPSASVREPPAPRATRQAAVQAAAPSGGGRYLVQVSSQRSEADAQAAYRNIQSRYSSVLGGHGHTIRRADLGSRGVYYRAMVGPFGTREEAVQVCSSLKSAGGDCIVH